MSILGSIRNASSTFRCRTSSTCRPGGIQINRENCPAAGTLDRELVLKLSERQHRSLRHETVGTSHHVDGQPAARKVLAHGCFDLAGGERQRTIGQHRVPVLDQIPPDFFAAVLQVRSGNSEIHAAPLRGPHRRGRNELQKIADVVRKVVQLQPEILFGIGPEDLVELAHLSGSRIFLEELIPEQRLELGWMKLAIDRRLQHFEDARFVADAHAALLLRGLAECRRAPGGPSPT